MAIPQRLGFVTSGITPFRQFVLKVHSRCDLTCDHCYMYEAVDQGWRKQPMAMSRATAGAVGRAIAEHAGENGLDLVRIVLHGGEPLLAGVDRLQAIIEAVREPLLAMPDPPHLDLRIHTNGVRLDRGFCDLFNKYDVKVGVSLDGDRAANDRHRRYANGNSSHDQVMAALALLRTPPYRHLYAGILCTVDIANDPETVYRAIAEARPPRIDLLLPHATWDVPPPRPDGVARASTLADPAYAEWLLAIYRLWSAERAPFRIRLFESIHSTLHGGPPLTEALGMAPGDVLVIETDGSIEQADSLKVAFEGAARTGLRVPDHPLSAAAENERVVARRSGPDGLAAQCLACPVLASCGSGLFAHRYRGAAADPAAAFRNPSVYCADLLTLIQTIQRTERTRAAAAELLTVPTEHFDQLASGLGGSAAIGALAPAQASIDRSLLAAAGRALASESTEGAAAWELLQALDERHPEAVARSISHPFLRGWAFKAIEAPLTTRPTALIGYALAAAAHAGHPAELPVPPDTAAVYLPGIGRIATIGGKAAVGNGGEPILLTQRSRYLRAGENGPEVLLEDLDDERDAFHLPPACRLSDEDFARWAVHYESARRLIEQRYPEYDGTLSAGLRALVPLRPSPDGHAASATARHAFGALSLAPAPDPEVFALLLMHEFQHVKLGALLDLFDLYDVSDTRLYYAPWREDPRPFEGLLQGTYAHVAVVDYWRGRAELADPAAQVHFARWRDQTWQALETLEASGSLTEIGRRLVSGMRRTLTPWLRVTIGTEALTEASRQSRAHRSAFESAPANSDAREVNGEHHERSTLPPWQAPE